MEQMNVVFMGMGEPLLNFDHLVTTLDVLYSNIAPRRVTVSTSGIIPGIEELAQARAAAEPGHLRQRAGPQAARRDHADHGEVSAGAS